MHRSVDHADLQDVAGRSAETQDGRLMRAQTTFPDQGSWIKRAMGRAGVKYVLESLEYDGPPEVYYRWDCHDHS